MTLRERLGLPTPPRPEPPATPAKPERPAPEWIRRMNAGLQRPLGVAR